MTEKETEKIIGQKKKKGYVEKSADANAATKPKIDPEIKQQRIKKLFGKHSIVGATIISKQRMGFITRAWGKNQNQSLEARSTILILYEKNNLDSSKGSFAGFGL